MPTNKPIRAPNARKGGKPGAPVTAPKTIDPATLALAGSDWDRKAMGTTFAQAAKGKAGSNERELYDRAISRADIRRSQLKKAGYALVRARGASVPKA